jgi:YD repeat-containing protein
VRATDAAGNLSGYSPTASATTQAPPDTQPPTAPTNLAVTVTSSTALSLSWGAATDNVGVTGYYVERCSGPSCSTFSQIASSATTSYGDAGLTAATSYSYRVRATDAAGNLGPYSNVGTGTTAAGSASYTYDTHGRLQTVVTPSGSTIHYTYDAAGNLIGIQTTP